MLKNLEEYYAKRALEYEKVYDKPERQKDLIKIGETLRSRFRNKKVLELGCGTGYWTSEIAKSAASITGVDINESVLEIAKEKKYACPTAFIKGSYYESGFSDYNAVFGGFIISHILNEDLSNFVENILVAMKGGIVVFVDNLFVEGNSTPIVRRDIEGNTYQMRKLESGKTYEVLKNYPSKADWQQIIASSANCEFQYQELEYFWLITIRKK